MTDRELTITRLFDAPRELVFRAWTDPERFAGWLGPEGFTGTAVTVNLAPGGAWRACLLADDGGEQWMCGTYREVDEPSLLVFTFAWDRGGELVEQTLVTITLAEVGDKTEMTFHQAEFSSTHQRDCHVDGWNSAFGKLAANLKESR
ncbi:SRPBCC family protein [Amycolatopsis sp. H20-H5]|uniref:SRPBCC family protein n=1 Tax=Amycolatopsis sp. H20-H5 TaxID=3046309 RepID=UPI002DB9A52E|nr:SRPBCC domain-containing protein [Amycolatopsis sp. H20-H5]MEC3977112.1 SRPBCC domain-containing protein [Amycolatopsis sp. H20-H5]